MNKNERSDKIIDMINENTVIHFQRRLLIKAIQKYTSIESYINYNKEFKNILKSTFKQVCKEDKVKYHKDMLDDLLSKLRS